MGCISITIYYGTRLSPYSQSSVIIMMLGLCVGTLCGNLMELGMQVGCRSSQSRLFEGSNEISHQ